MRCSPTWRSWTPGAPGQNRIGVFTGVWTAGETLGLDSSGLDAVILAAGGYVSTRQGSVVQPDSALTAMTVGFSAVPAVLVALSLLVLCGYGLSTDQTVHRPEEPHAS